MVYINAKDVVEENEASSGFERISGEKETYDPAPVGNEFGVCGEIREVSAYADPRGAAWWGL